MSNKVIFCVVFFWCRLVFTVRCVFSFIFFFFLDGQTTVYSTGGTASPKKKALISSKGLQVGTSTSVDSGMQDNFRLKLAYEDEGGYTSFAMYCANVLSTFSAHL